MTDLGLSIIVQWCPKVFEMSNNLLDNFTSYEVDLFEGQEQGIEGLRGQPINLFPVKKEGNLSQRKQCEGLFAGMVFQCGARSMYCRPLLSLGSQTLIFPKPVSSR